MTPSDDLSPPRRPIFFPVVIATVFLTIIGMTAGFVLGERHRERSAAASKSPTDTTETETTAATAPPPTRADSRPLCPQETRDFAAQEKLPTDLYQVMRVVTDNGTTVWICEDPQGRLYYQGKTGGEDSPLVQKGNGLFLTNVTRLSDDEYEAVAANKNRFVVTRARFSVFFADGRPTQVNKVLQAD